MKLSGSLTKLNGFLMELNGLLVSTAALLQLISPRAEKRILKSDEFKAGRSPTEAAAVYVHPE